MTKELSRPGGQRAAVKITIEARLPPVPDHTGEANAIVESGWMGRGGKSNWEMGGAAPRGGRDSQAGCWRGGITEGGGGQPRGEADERQTKGEQGWPLKEGGEPGEGAPELR